MSKRVDLNQPLTEEQKDYLRSRSRGWEVDVNEKRFGKPQAVDLLGDIPPIAQNLQPIPVKPEPAERIPLPEADPVNLHGLDSELAKDVKALNFNELRAELKANNLPATGTKEHMQFVLLKALAESNASAEVDTPEE